MSNRADLAEKMEIIGQVFEIDGMNEMLAKYESGMTRVKFNAVTIQVSGKLLKQNKKLADRIIAMSLEESIEKVEEMDDVTYANALKNAIIRDVMGFFVSSPPTDGQK